MKDHGTRLNALAGLRWVAALVVAFAHLPEVNRDPRLGRVLARFLSEGMYGLTFFYILSGFVLAYGYHHRLARPTRSAVAAYSLARFARVWPLHILTLLVTLILPVSPWPGSPETFVANLALVHAWVPDLQYIQSYNSVSWSLSIEFFFYLVFPLLIGLVARWNPRLVVWYLAAFGVWLLSLTLLLPLSAYEGFWPLYLGNVCPPVRCCEFVIGVLMGMAFVREEVKAGLAATPRWRRWSTLAEVLAVLFLALLIYRSHHVPILFRLSGYYVPAAAVLVAVFARERGYLSWVLNQSWSVRLGEVSFAFYLFHAIVFVHLGAVLSSHLSPWPRSLLLIVLCTGLSYLAHQGIELPSRSFLLWLFRPKTPKPD